MSSLVETPIRDKALHALNQLPPFSPTLNKLLATLAKEDVFISEIAGIVEKDTVLAGQVLKIVNSALYSRSGTINSVAHAVAILGLNKLRNLALSMSVTRLWNQMKAPPAWSQANFNLHSVATAILADALAQRLDSLYPEGAFTAGLMHAMGKMLISFTMPVEMQRILETCQQSGCAAEPIEQQRLGVCHSELAAIALGHWKLPSEIQHAVASQHLWPEGRNGKQDLATILHMAHNIAHQLGVGFLACVVPEQPSLEATFESLGLGPQRERILDEFKKEFETLKAFF